MKTPTIAPPALNLVRLPGEWGPRLRCSGELSVATSEALRRELDLLAPLARPALILNVSGCRTLDAAGMMTVLHVFRQWRGMGRRLLLVADAAGQGRLLNSTGIDRIIPIYPSEAEAARALSTGGERHDAV
jgi:anti-anti-sigma factor